MPEHQIDSDSEFISTINKLRRIVRIDHCPFMRHNLKDESNHPPICKIITNTIITSLISTGHNLSFDHRAMVKHSHCMYTRSCSVRSRFAPKYILVITILIISAKQSYLHGEGIQSAVKYHKCRYLG